MPCLLINISNETSRLKVSISKISEEDVTTIITSKTSPLLVKATHKKVKISSIINKIGESLSISTKYNSTKLDIKCSVLCSIKIVDNEYELFNAADGIFILYDGESYKVLREDGI